MAKDQLVTPFKKVEALPTFEGLPTIATSLEVRGIEGGFNEGLTVDPVVFHRGDDVYLLVHGVVDDILHKSVKDANAWRRAHVVRVQSGTIVTADYAQGHLEAEALRIEAARGISRLPWDGEDEDDEATVFARNHAAGNHADGLVEGCPDCDEEADLVAEEAEAE